MFVRTDETVSRFIAQARSHLGYRAHPGMVNQYGGLVGYNGLPWSGAFVDVVARETGIILPACVYSPSGLAEFSKQGRVHTRPRPGDIVFYSFATGEAGDFGMPHVGIVTEVTDWDRHGRFKAVEGQTGSGLARGNQSKDGVFERVRFEHDVLAFARPEWKRLAPASSDFREEDGRPELKFASIRVDKRNPAVEQIQLALGVKCGLRNANRGMWDGPTRAAYARWQRAIGYVGKDVTGMPDSDSLERLGRETGYWRVRV